jgi:hypothetical protein
VTFCGAKPGFCIFVHLMPHAAKGKDGDHATTPRVDFHRWQEVLEMSRRSFSGYAPSARTSAKGLGTKKGGKATGGNYSTVNSPQRLSATLSIRPRGRVQIIDSDWAAFWSVKIYEWARQTCNFVQSNLNVCVSDRLSARSVMICARKWQHECHIACECRRLAVFPALPALQRFLDEIARIAPVRRCAALPGTTHAF